MILAPDQRMHYHGVVLPKMPGLRNAAISTAYLLMWRRGITGWCNSVFTERRRHLRNCSRKEA